MPRKETYAGPLSAQAQQDLLSEGIENFELPKSVVMKIAKSSIPDNVKLQKETVLSLVKGSTVFINYLAATAHDVAQSRQHKSISASDVLRALELLEFADLSVRLQPELQIYRDMQKAEPSKSKKGANGSASVAKKATASSASASGVSKGKGKERLNPQGNPLPPPFTSTPLESSGPHEGAVESISGTGIAMDVDDENADVEEVDEEVEEVDDIVEETEEGIAVDQGTSDEEKELVGEALEEQIPADDKD